MAPMPVDPSSYSLPLPLAWGILVAIVTVGGGTLVALTKIAVQFGAWMARYEALETKVTGHDEKLGAVQAVVDDHSDRINSLRLDVNTRLASVEAHTSHRGE